MCFSAPVSFVASGVLATIGVAANARRLSFSERLLAVTPLLFAVQQATEGSQWLVFEKTGGTAPALGYVFAFFAYFLWPIYIPLMVYLLEPKIQKRKLLHVCLALGVIAGGYLGGNALINGLDVAVVDRGLGYSVAPSIYAFTVVASLSFLIATAGSLMLSSHFWLRILGMAVLVSYCLTLLISYATSTSVWCFFAAVLSLIVVVQVRKFKTSNPEPIIT